MRDGRLSRVRNSLGRSSAPGFLEDIANYCAQFHERIRLQGLAKLLDDVNCRNIHAVSSVSEDAYAIVLNGNDSGSVVTAAASKFV
jgi:hypothetical protein